MRATYNITTNRFKVWFDARLTQEEYKRAKDCNFVWYPGQKCFSSIWYPQSEDFITSFGIEIEEDDTPDDLEARVNRFEKYAERAGQASESAARRAIDATTERRAKAAESAAVTESERAAHWQGRIAGAIANAQHKDRPDVIARRIKGLEADLRRHERDQITRGTRDGYALTGNNAWVKPEELPALHEHARRWISHLNRRLEYERAYLVAVGGEELLEPKPRAKRAAAPDDGIKKGVRVTVPMPPYHNTFLTGEVVSLGALTVKVKLTRDGINFFDYKIGRRFVKVEA